MQSVTLGISLQIVADFSKGQQFCDSEKSKFREVVYDHVLIMFAVLKLAVGHQGSKLQKTDSRSKCHQFSIVI